MNVQLSSIRVDVMIKKYESQMIAAATRIDKRPSFDGCNALQKTQNHNLLTRHRDDSGMQALQMVAGGMTLASAAMDVAVDTYANRQSTRSRPQDKKSYTANQEAEYREANNQDMRLFFNLEERLNTLYAYSSCGVTHIDIDGKTDTIKPSTDKPDMPMFNKKLSPQEQAELNESLKFAQSSVKLSTPGMGA